VLALGVSINSSIECADRADSTKHITFTGDNWQTMSRIFDSRGIVVTDYDKVEAQIEALLVAARAARCRCIVVNVPSGQLLYLGNRTSDALAAVRDVHCQLFYTTDPKSAARRSTRRTT
jgi:hypothetical protein